MKKLITCGAAVLAVFCACDKNIEPEPAPLAPPAEVWLSASSGTSLTFSWTEVEDAVRYALRLDRSDDGFDRLFLGGSLFFVGGDRERLGNRGGLDDRRGKSGMYSTMQKIMREISWEILPLPGESTCGPQKKIFLCFS